MDFSSLLFSVSFQRLIGRHLRFRRFATSFFFFTSFALYYSIFFNPLQFALLLSIYPAFAVLLSFFIFHFLLQFYGLRLYIHDFGRFNRGRHYMDIPPFFHFPSCLNFLSSDLFILRAWVCL